MAEITVSLPKQREYKDISLSFGKNPVTNDVVVLTGIEAVKRSIKTILMTQTGEIPFFPAFGSRVRYLLFEPIDPITTALLQSEIFNSLTAFEPRAKIVSLVVQPDEDNNQFQVSLTLQILNQIQPINLTLFLSRLR